MQLRLFEGEKIAKNLATRIYRYKTFSSLALRVVYQKQRLYLILSLFVVKTVITQCARILPPKKLMQTTTISRVEQASFTNILSNFAGVVGAPFFQFYLNTIVTTLELAPILMVLCVCLWILVWMIG